MLVMKVVYVTLDALKSDRIRKIAYSIKKCGSVEFNVIFPKIRLVRRGGIMNCLFAGIIIWLLFCRLCLLRGCFFGLQTVQIFCFYAPALLAGYIDSSAESKFAF